MAMPDDPRRTLEEPGPVDLGAESTVTEYDRRIAPRFWARYGTSLLRALLRAKALDPSVAKSAKGLEVG